MKRIAYFIAIIIFLVLVVGCGSSSTPTTPEQKPTTLYDLPDKPQPTKTTYIGNSNSMVFHRVQGGCEFSRKISKSHQVFFATREEAIKAGYRPSKTCNP